MIINGAARRPPRAIWVFVGYVVFLGLLAFGTRDVTSEPDVWAFTVDRLIREGIGLNDPTSFATAAVDVYETGWIREANNWIFNLWPPGLPVIEAAILAVFGREAPILAILQSFAVVLHAVVAASLYVILRQYISSIFAICAGAVPFVFPVVRVFLLQPTGVALGETFAAGFFSLGMLASVSVAIKPRYPLAIAAGVSLAFAAYIRSQFEFILMIQTFVTCALVTLALLGILQKVLGTRISKRSLICFVVIILTTQMSMLPWRIYHKIHDGSPKWVLSTDIVMRNAVMSDSELYALDGNFVILGGGNVVCKINPQACGNLNQARSLFFDTFVQQPVQWLEYKARLLPTYWFAPIGTWTAVVTEPTLFEVIYNAIFAFTITAAVILVFTARSIRQDSAWLALSLFNVTLWVSYGAILVFAHLEARYLYFPKFIGMVLFLIEIAIIAVGWTARKSTAHLALRPEAGYGAETDPATRAPSDTDPFRRIDRRQR